MRYLTILAAIAALALIALTVVPMPALAPTLAMYRDMFIYGALGAAALVVVLLLVSGGGKTEARPPVAEAAQPKAPPPAPHQAEAEVVAFLATLQEQGRLVDFLMEDITAYNDAQVASAARVVHQGCRAVLNDHLHVTPIRAEAEGATVTVPAGYAADEYRLVGKIASEAPFSGVLVHRGWKTESVKLPRVLTVAGDRLPTLAPAEVELS